MGQKRGNYDPKYVCKINSEEFIQNILRWIFWYIFVVFSDCILFMVHITFKRINAFLTHETHDRLFKSKLGTLQLMQIIIALSCHPARHWEALIGFKCWI